MEGRSRHALIQAARRAAALATLALTLAPAAALADVPPAAVFGPGTQAEALARQIARDRWGGEPCGGTVTVSWTQLALQTNATSTWTNPTDAYANASQNFNCQVQFNVAGEFDWPKFCTVMVHEYGHLWGQRHSADEHDLMNAYYIEPFAGCAAVPDPTAPPAAPTSSSPSVATAPSRTAVRTNPRTRRASYTPRRKARSRRANARSRRAISHTGTGATSKSKAGKRR